MLRRHSNDGQTLPRPVAAADAGERAEQRLLAEVAARRMLAFEALYRGYYPRLTRFLDRMTRRPELVEEVLDDTMFVVWSRAASYNGQCKVSTWIFAIAYRKALKALQRLDEPVADVAADEHPSADPGPEERFGAQQLHQALTAALGGLSVEHRAVVELTYFHGAGYREIAQIVDCPVDTVKTRMFHARRRLRTLLAGSLGDWL